VVTTKAVPKAMVTARTAPITTAMPELATIAHTLRIGPGRLYSGTVVSATPMGVHGRRTIGSLRGVRGTALAFLRHPVKTRASTARPRIHPA